MKKYRKKKKEKAFNTDLSHSSFYSSKSLLLEEQPADPLSIENENHKELELMNDISTLQTDLKEAESKANTLQQQLHAMEKAIG